MIIIAILISPCITYKISTDECDQPLTESQGISNAPPILGKCMLEKYIFIVQNCNWLAVIGR